LHYPVVAYSAVLPSFFIV